MSMFVWWYTVPNGRRVQRTYSRIHQPYIALCMERQSIPCNEQIWCIIWLDQVWNVYAVFYNRIKYNQFSCVSINLASYSNGVMMMILHKIFDIMAFGLRIPLALFNANFFFSTFSRPSIRFTLRSNSSAQTFTAHQTQLIDQNYN